MIELEIARELLNLLNPKRAEDYENGFIRMVFT